MAQDFNHRIVDYISDTFKIRGWKSPYLFIDINAYDGKLTWALLNKFIDSSSIAVSASNYESLFANLRKDQRIEVRKELLPYNQAFPKTIPDNLAGSILVINGMPNVGDMKFKKYPVLNYYYFEEWFEYSRICSAVVLITDHKTLFQRVRDYVWYYEDIDPEHRVTIGFSPYGKLALERMSNAVKKYHKELGISGDLEEFVNELVTEEKKTIPKDEWKNNLKSSLREILLRYGVESNDGVDKLFQPKAMEMWYNAFTHQSADLENNYETLETIGDKKLDDIFIEYLFQIFGAVGRAKELTPQAITGIKSAYMEKPVQGEMSRTMGLTKLVYKAGGVIESLSMAEDLFESFFGALAKIGNEIIGKKDCYLGVGYCVRAMTGIFNVHYPGQILKRFEELKGGNPKTQVNQSFEMLKIKNQPYIESKGDETTMQKYVELVVYIEPWIYDKVKKLVGSRIEDFVAIPDKYRNINLGSWKYFRPGKDYLLGYGRYRTQHVAEINAFIDALEYMQKKGLTRKLIQRISHEIDLGDYRFVPYIPKTLEKLSSENKGYIDFTFIVPKSSVAKGYHVVQLYGVKGDGTQDLLVTAHSNDREEAKKKALIGYINRDSEMIKNRKFLSLVFENK